jgi:branched-chain amino acid transport system permease protein
VIPIAVRRALPWLGAAALLLWALGSADSYQLRLLAQAGILATAALGFQLVFGLAGQINLAQGCFFGVGAYATAILGTTHGWPPGATLPMAVLLPALGAALIAVPVLRLESHYFALATLGIAQVAALVAINAESWTGGANGLPGVPPLKLLGWTAPPALVAWIAAGAVAIGLAIIDRRGTGLALRVLRVDDLAAGAQGIDGARLRFLAFVAGAAAAGLAGALHAHLMGVVSPDAIEFPVMVTILAITVIGGRTHPGGVIVAALLLVFLPEWLRILEGRYLIAYGLAMLAIILFAPEGLAGLWRRWVPPTAERLPAAARVGPATQAAALSVARVSRAFGGVQALDDVTVTVNAGEIVGVIGPNGSGKTTLLNAIAGQARPGSGTVHLGDARLDGRPPHAIARAGIARAFQTPRLIADMTALDAVAVARRGRPLTLARGDARTLLARVGAEADATAPCGALPHGTRRRVEIARAMALDPAILLLDEPAAGLSGREQRDLARLLRDLAAERVGLLVVEHDLGFLLPLADRVVCLAEGRVIADGPPEAVRHDPAVLAAYLGVAS